MFIAHLHVPITLQVVEICWSHQLYDAMTYVYNRGLNDYATPLLELLLQLRAALKKGKPISGTNNVLGITTGYKCWQVIIIVLINHIIWFIQH